MKKWLKLILFSLGILAIVGSIIVYRIYTKPHRDVTEEKGLTITAQQLFDAFKENETAANQQYLDKAIEVSGEIADINTNQDGKTVVNIKTNDPFFVINCTLKTNSPELKPGQQITFKGICTGYIPDANVVINEGIIIK